MKRIFTLLFFVGLSSSELIAQDATFSQFYNAPLYLNPAMTGTTKGHRFIANYRNQWPAIPATFVTYAISYDVNFTEWNSGFGFQANTDKAGVMGLRSTSFNLLHSYRIKINKEWEIRSGLSFGYARRNLDYSRLVFGDQLLGDENTPSAEPFNADTFTDYFDFSSGAFLHSKNYWLGFAAHHINKPDQSVTENHSYLPIRYVLHGGARFATYNGVFKKERVLNIAPAFLYKKQDRFDQLDLGMHFYYEPFMTGIWYRGLPVLKKDNENFSHDAITVLIGFKLKEFNVGYSYDLTVSKLGASSGGAHEVSLSYEIPRKKKIKSLKREIPCPAFMR
jgi:type IX secretion system PorP/SprF family membrane protein